MKRTILIIVSVTVLIIIGTLIFAASNISECEGISGGSFGLIYETNGGESLELSSVCIACPPDTYADLPVPVKEGYTFDGWYYDKKLTKKVDGTSTLDVEPNPVLVKDACITGYKDVTLYAKWK